ncbi:MAG TPA: polysaccharide deacetylase family protein [Terriglobales bacterium]|nr:polysaccharide deacetylase family protein [Terriglobales bacterium]
MSANKNDANFEPNDADGPGKAGRQEVRLCREQRGYRARSPLSRLTAGPRWWLALRISLLRWALFRRVVLAFSNDSEPARVQTPIPGGLGRRFRQWRDDAMFFCAAVEEAGGWEPFRREFAQRIPALCYHHVGASVKGSWRLLTISPQVLQKQMRWLAERGYTGISASQWLAWLEAGAPLPEKPVLLTFDDAYSELLKTAMPVLRRHGFHASLFVVSQHLGGVSTWDAALGYPSLPLMSAAQVLQAQSFGIEVGSHTRSHPDLRKLSTASLRQELELSRDELSRLAGRPVRTVAYPFGCESASVRACAAEFYDLAFSCKAGLNGWGSDRHQLRRMFVHPSRFNFALQVKYGVDLHALWRFIPERAHRLWRQLALRFGFRRGHAAASGARRATKVWIMTRPSRRKAAGALTSSGAAEGDFVRASLLPGSDEIQPRG